MAQEPIDKPGEMALVAIKTLTNSMSIFKVPKMPTQKPKQKDKMTILNEDQYVEVNNIFHYTNETCKLRTYDQTL